MKTRMILALLAFVAAPALAADTSPVYESPFYRNQFAVSHALQERLGATPAKSDTKAAVTNEAQSAPAQMCKCRGPT